MHATLLYLLCISLLVASPVQADVYSCEKNGVLIFSDTPCSGKQLNRPDTTDNRNGAKRESVPATAVSWQVAYTRIHNIHLPDPRRGLRIEKETEHVIDCKPGYAQRRVYTRHDGRIYLRDGEMIHGAEPGRYDRQPGHRFSSFDEAARYACSHSPPPRATIK